MKIPMEHDYTAPEMVPECPACGAENLCAVGQAVTVRQGEVEVPFECECCEDTHRLIIRFHKGNTFLNWRKDQRPRVRSWNGPEQP